jgi:hypothetical protein
MDLVALRVEAVQENQLAKLAELRRLQAGYVA